MSDYQITFTCNYKTDIVGDKERTMDVKDSSAIIPLTFNFKNLPDNVSIVSATFAISVAFTGTATDTTTLALHGGYSVSQTVPNEAKVTQGFSDGTPGITYKIKVSMLDGDGNLFVGSTLLEVRDI